MIILGLVYVASSISDAHKNYLKAGGNGFIPGDGNLNYAPEHLTELYYSFQLNSNIYVSATYQLLFNTGYNADRNGPVNVFSGRLHIRI